MAIRLDRYLADSWTHQHGVQGKIKLAVLAAGLGRRMEPLTTHYLPKPMFPLGGTVPMVEMWVRRAVQSGITDISMNLCVLSEAIRSHFQDGTKFGAALSYVEEEMPSGTLGGICKQALGKTAKKVLASETLPPIDAFHGTTVLAPSGDIVSNFGAELLERMYDIHTKKGAAISMILTPVPWDKRSEFGTVELLRPDQLDAPLSQSGQVVNFREKDPHSPSNLNNASIYMIEMELLKRLDSYRTEADPAVENPFYDFGKHVFPALLGKLPYVTLPKDFTMWGLQYDGLWFDVGRKEDYIDVNKSFLDGDFDLEIPYEKLPWGYLGMNVDIDFSRVTIIPPVVIGNGCKIAPGATVGPYAVIGDGWRIGGDAGISNAVLWKPYAYFADDSSRSGVERTRVDQHEIRPGVRVDKSIVVGGTIADNLQDTTVDVLEDGQIAVFPLDYVPEGPRA